LGMKLLIPARPPHTHTHTHTHTHKMLSYVSIIFSIIRVGFVKCEITNTVRKVKGNVNY